MDNTYIIILGKPGAGKDTQAQRLAPHYNIHHFSTSERLRDVAYSGSDLGEHIAQTMANGLLVDDDTIADIVEEDINNHRNILFNGFPRNLSQKQLLDTIVASQSATQIPLYLDTPNNAANARMLARGRTDDNENTITTRMQTFYAETKPVIDAYRSHPNFMTIDATSTPDDVFHQLTGCIEQYLTPASADRVANR